VLEVGRRDLIDNVDAVFLRQLAETIGLGVAATLAVIGLAVPVVLAGRLVPGGATRAAALTAGLGYALPGTILVLGLLAPLVAVDGLASRLVSALTGNAPGLLLTGSLGGLVVAYTIRFLRVGADPLAASVVGRGGDLEGAARVLGARPASLVRHVHLPLMRPALGAAALLVFVDCLKELPATLLLRPLNTETMATLVYGAASRGAFEEGALAALFIVAVGLGPVIWLNGRMSRPARPVQPRVPLRARFVRRQAATRSLTATV
jgi:iron(III) transport system permease protein